LENKLKADKFMTAFTFRNEWRHREYRQISDTISGIQLSDYHCLSV